MSELGVIERIDRLLAWHHCQDYTPLDQVDELEIIKADVITLRAELENVKFEYAQLEEAVQTYGVENVAKVEVQTMRADVERLTQENKQLKSLLVSFLQEI